HGPLVLSACRHVLRDDAAAEDAFQGTFTLLYRTAGSIRNRPSLAGWLFRVARRCASNVRRSAERRERREARAARRETTLPTDATWREALAILHEELDRLPDLYRLPLIHCYLQGLSRDEAARRLGWSLNEVRGRLERGRSRLRGRLEKRGIALSAGLLATVTTGRVVSAELISSTLNAIRSSPPPVVHGLTWSSGIGLAIAAALVVGVAVHDHDAQAQPTPAKARPADPPPAIADAPIVSGR